MYKVQFVTLKTTNPGPNIMHQSPLVLDQKIVPAAEVRSVAEHFRAQPKGWVEVYNEDGQIVELFEPVFKDGAVVDVKYVGP